MAPCADQPPSPWVTRFAHLVPEGGEVLDVAAGGGRHARCFVERGHPVTAVDTETKRLEDLRDAIEGRGGDDAELRVLRADLEGEPWPLAGREFAGVVVTNYLWRPLLPDLAASVAPGGVLLYETFARGNERFGKPSNPDFLLRSAELCDAFGSELQIVAFEQGEVRAPKPAVVQRVCAVRSVAAQLI